MTNAKSKRNHWVPSAYLKYFTIENDKIWVIPKKNGEPKPRSIFNVPIHFYLYTPKKDGVRDYSFEGKLSEMENSFQSDYWKLLCNDFVDFKEYETRREIALLVAIMYFRNPNQLNLNERIHKDIVKAVNSLGTIPESVILSDKELELDSETWASYRDADEDDIKRMWIKQISSATSLAKILLEMRWTILTSDSPVFITSDNPVVIIHPSRRFKGLKDPDTRLIFPLSPTRVLSLDNILTEPDGEYHPVNDTSALINMFVWDEAIKNVFSSREPDDVCTEISRKYDRDMEQNHPKYPIITSMQNFGQNLANHLRAITKTLFQL